MAQEKTIYDYMRQADRSEEDAMFPEEIVGNRKSDDKEDYFDFYDDIKTSLKDDW